MTAMRIGEVARRVGTTGRTLRYYEELGLLPAGPEREPGTHRLFTEEDVERIEALLRLRNVLGVSLDELRTLVEDEDARGLLREEFRSEGASGARQLELLDQAEAMVERQAALVARQRAQLDALDAELAVRRERIAARRAEVAGRSRDPTS